MILQAAFLLKFIWVSKYHAVEYIPCKCFSIIIFYFLSHMKQKCAYMRSWLKVLILTVRKLQISCCQLSFSMWSTLFMADWLYPIKGIHIICKNTLSWIILLNASRILRYKLFFRRLIKISIKSIFFKYILRCKKFFQLHEG